MRKSTNLFLILFLFGWIIGCDTKENTTTTVISPSTTISIEFMLNNDGSPNYIVKHKGNIAIDTSKMSFDFKDQASLQSGLKIIKVETNTVNED